MGTGPAGPSERNRTPTRGCARRDTGPPTRRSAAPAGPASRPPTRRSAGPAPPPDPARGGRIRRTLRAARAGARPTTDWADDQTPEELRDDGHCAKPLRERIAARADRRPGPHQRADRLRGRRRPDPAALPADVPAGLGPRAHRQPGGPLAAARVGGRGRSPGYRPALRRLPAPARRAADAPAAAADRGPRATRARSGAGCWTCSTRAAPTVPRWSASGSFSA